MRPMRTGRERAFPFYVVCDVSQSMWDPAFQPPGQLVLPFDVLREAIPNLLFGLERNATVAEAAMISVITFADAPHVHLGLMRPDEVVLPTLEHGYATDYAAVFRDLRTVLSHDCEGLAKTHDVRRPAVFFLTDGQPDTGHGPQPEGVWAAPLAQLTAPAFPWRPQIVAFGLGDVEERTLCRVATAHDALRLAFMADAAADSGAVVGAIMHALSVAIADTITRGKLVVQAPAGMRLACGARATAER
jgi:hypothetical protein